jgi:sn-glycerol 3-phosphate transport system permease protein
MSSSAHFRRRRRISLTIRYAVLTVAAIVIVFPLYIIFLDSLLSIKDITSTPPTLFSTHLNWNIFVQAWDAGGLARALVNSLIQTVSTVAGQLVTSILAAFAFAFLRFPLKRTLFVLTLATLMIPFEVTVTSNLQTVTTLHLNGNMGGLIVPFLATGFGIYLLRQAFSQIPREMREAAVIDGYTNMQFLRKVAIPMARPSIAALTVFSFLGAWNSYLWPDILTSNNQSIRTLQIQISALRGDITSANLQIAAAAITVLPLLVVLFFFQKQLIRSLSSGAVK